MYEGKNVREVINELQPLTIIDAQSLYEELFSNTSEHAYFKMLSRMQQKDIINRLSKGVYFKPKKGRFGNRMPSQKDIVNHYMGPGQLNGIIIGYRLYNHYGLTTQVSKTVELYSNMVQSHIKHIRHVTLYHTKLEINASVRKMVEWLEILENLHTIEDLNRKALIHYFEEVVMTYKDETLDYVLEHLKFKKHTIASLKAVLDYYRIPHTVDHYLNKTSRYKSLDMEAIYEIALGQ